MTGYDILILAGLWILLDLVIVALLGRYFGEVDRRNSREGG